VKYAIIYFFKTSDGGLCKDVQFVDTYEEVQEFLKKAEYVNDIYYVLEVSNDLTLKSWDYMRSLGKIANYEDCEKYQREGYVIVKGNGKQALNGFEDNGLPIKDKYDPAHPEKAFSGKLFHFSKHSYMLFETKEEAESYIELVKEIIKSETGRYEACLAGSTEKLMKIAESFRVVKEFSIW
jgi:hypothetical protein